MEIIKFPGGISKVPVAETTKDQIAKLIVGPMSFTCTGCGETCRAEFDGMIFKILEFHCSGCGTFFKITNPAFTLKR